MDKKRRSSIAVAEYKKSIAIKPNIIDAGIHEQFREGKLDNINSGLIQIWTSWKRLKRMNNQI